MRVASWIERFDRRFDGWGIPYTVQTIAVLSGLCYILGFIQPGFLQLFDLDVEKIMQGQVWRVFTFLILPWHNALFMIIYLWAIWSVGSAVEHVWGPLRMNIYFLICILAHLVVAFSVYYFGQQLANLLTNPSNPSTAADAWPQWIAYSGYYGYYIPSTLFIVYGTLFPDASMMFFPIPVPFPAKYLAIAGGIITFLFFLIGSPWEKMAILASFAGYVVFFISPAIEAWKDRKKNQRRLAQIRGER